MLDFVVQSVRGPALAVSKMRDRPDWRSKRIIRHLRRLWTLLTAPFRLGPGILACSLAVALVLGGCALIYPKALDESGEAAYRDASSRDTVAKSGNETGATARTTPP